MSAELFDYGIHNESSDIRAHVGMLTNRVYVFSTADGKRVFKEWKDRKEQSLPAYQLGVETPTAWGFAVPWNSIPNIKVVKFPREWAIDFSFTSLTTEKGRVAVDIVTKLLKQGSFPLWIEGIECQDREINISGTDIIVKGKWKIQVKCDAKCGHREYGGSGNLYLQICEANPLKRF